MSMRLELKLKEENERPKLRPTVSNKKRGPKSTELNKRLEERKLKNKWNWKGLKENRKPKKHAKSILESKLRDNNNMNNSLLKEKQELKHNVKSRKKLN